MLSVRQVFGGLPCGPGDGSLPHQLVRLAVLGNVDRIVDSKSIWLCLTCHTCGARCPNGIDVPALLDPIRHQVLRKNISTRNRRCRRFHTTFHEEHQDIRPGPRAVPDRHVQDEDQDVLFRHGTGLADVPKGQDSSHAPPVEPSERGQGSIQAVFLEIDGTPDTH